MMVVSASRNVSYSFDTKPSLSSSPLRLCLPIDLSSDMHNRITPTTTTTSSRDIAPASIITTKLSDPIILQSTSPRQNDEPLIQLHSPVVTLSSPAQSPLTPMGTDTDFTYPLSSYSNGSTSSNSSINGTVNGAIRIPATANVTATTPTRDHSQHHTIINSFSQQFLPSTTAHRQVSSSLIQQPTASAEISSVQQPPSVTSQAQDGTQNVFPMNNETRTILQRNTARLNELATGIQQLVTYGTACDEFLAWLQDFRAYNEHNEPSLMKCAEVGRLFIRE